MEAIADLKTKGNAAFSQEDFPAAIAIYSQAISLPDITDDLKATLLSNRAACYLKLKNFDQCVTDSTACLAIQPRQTKALFRRASAYKSKNDFKNAATDLQILLSIDSGNKEATGLLREVRINLQKEQATETEIKKILTYIQSSSANVETGLKNLISLCSDDKSHAIDFGRKGGIGIVNGILTSQLAILKATSEESKEYDSSQNICIYCLKTFISMCNHAEFILSYVDFSVSDDSNNDKIKLESITKLFNDDNDLARSAVTLFMYILRSIPYQAIGSSTPLAVLSDSKATPTLTPSLLFLQKDFVELFLARILNALKSGSFEIQVMCFDLLTAFFSETPDYFSSTKEIDTRLESMEERKTRFGKQRILQYRSQCHAEWAVEVGLVEQLVECLDGESVMSRQRAGPCFGRLITAYRNVEQLKKRLQPYIVLGPQDSTDTDTVQQVYGPSDFPAVNLCRRRAALEAALLLQPTDELATWALPQPGGISQLLMLISTYDERCQLIASEVFCLAASNENTSPLLSSVVSSGSLSALMASPNPAIRAAGVSTLTKLSIKSKAIDEASPETGHILHTVLSVINSFDTLKKEEPKSSPSKQSSIVSFSNIDKKLAEPTPKPHEFFLSHVKKDDGLALTAVERAVEVLAAMVGRTYVKEELVHGSNRVAASMPALLKLADELDVRSTAAYGLAHIISSLTVTNHELKLKALADKELSAEQYDQLKELQRIKTKDEEGNPLEEPKEEADPDNNVLCRNRIKKLSNANAVPVMLRLLSDGSPQTKEAAARSLEQMMVEESIRGAAIQQGLIKVCCAAVNDLENPKKTRLAAAHAIAKALVTTNPTVLSEHLRLSSFGPLFFLCKEIDATSLEQFEALLSITNLLSCGEAEQNKFTNDKGVQTVHYLMFSDNLMVRRAATEAICNLADNETLVKILRQPDKVRFWLALSEDWNNSDNLEESLKIASAASATLAMTCSDEDVAKAIVSEDVAKTILALLESERPELIHRALIVLVQTVQVLGYDAAKHFFEGGVVPAIGVVAKLGNEQLANLAREAANELSKAMKNAP